MTADPVDPVELAAILDVAIPDPSGPGCVLGVVGPDGTLTTACRGIANLEHGVEIRTDTVFHVASLSKQFTAYAVQLLVDAGAFELDDIVREYLPWVPFEDITVEHLIRHMSGLRDQWQLVEASGGRMEDVITTDDLKALIARQRGLNFVTGTRHEYSNTNYTVLAALVEQASGMPFPAFCAERIFEPLGMRQTRFVADHREVVAGRADSYEPDDSGGYRRIALSYSTVGATSLNTTVPNLATWLTFAARPDIHRMRTRRRPLPEPGQETYGLGVRVGQRQGHDLVYHAGADAGYRSHFLALPEIGIATVAVSNSAAVQPADLCRKALDLALGAGPQPADRPVIGHDGDSRLDPPAGCYADIATGLVVDLRATSDACELDTVDGPLALHRVGPRAFATPEGDLTVEVADDGRLSAHVDPATEPRAWALLTPDDEPAASALERYAGTFVSDELAALLHILVSDAGLELVRPRRPAAVLRRVTQHVFTADLPDTHEAQRVMIAFSSDGDSLSYSTSQARDIAFQRATLAPAPSPTVRDLLRPHIAGRETQR
jgi:CubicO group peptidase (beta-lactamase class C family)